jgi:lipid-A-disaccharide synthase
VRIFLSTGEASGDMYGAYLLREIRKLQPKSPMRIEAIGGRLLKAEGAYMVADSSRWGAMGVVEAAKVFPRVARSYARAKKLLRTGEPGLFVPIDFGFMNVKLCAYAKQVGWRVLYFMPPGSWKRSVHGESLPSITDEVVTPFEWSSGVLSAQGAHVHWYGHPLKQVLHDSSNVEVERDPARIAILPGSRAPEVDMNMSVIARAADRITKYITLEFAVASSIDPNHVVRLWRRHYQGERPVIFTQDDAMGVLRRCHAAIVCSGTATLQAALCRCPMVVIYRVSKMAEMEARVLRIRPKFISLPNIVLNKSVVPELIQQAASPKAIAIELLQLVEEGPERQAQLEAFEQVDELLGGEDAITRTASLALRLLING